MKKKLKMLNPRSKVFLYMKTLRLRTQPVILVLKIIEINGKPENFGAPNSLNG